MDWVKILVVGAFILVLYGILRLRAKCALRYLRLFRETEREASQNFKVRFVRSIIFISILSVGVLVTPWFPIIIIPNWVQRILLIIVLIFSAVMFLHLRKKLTNKSIIDEIKGIKKRNSPD